MEQIYDNWKEYEIDEALNDVKTGFDCRSGYSSERYAQEAKIAVQNYIDSHYRTAPLMSGKDLAILSAAIYVLKEKSQ